MADDLPCSGYWPFVGVVTVAVTTRGQSDGGKLTSWRTARGRGNGGRHVTDMRPINGDYGSHVTENGPINGDYRSHVRDRSDQSMVISGDHLQTRAQR